MHGDICQRPSVLALLEVPGGAAAAVLFVVESVLPAEGDGDQVTDELVLIDGVVSDLGDGGVAHVQLAEDRETLLRAWVG